MSDDVTEHSRVGVIHLHSDYSHDGRDSLECLRDSALERGIGFMCLTDHAEDLDDNIFQEYVRHCHAVSDDRVRLIPGLEFRFNGFPGLHLLALGLERWITPETPGAFLDQASEHARFTVMAHPVYPKYRAPEEVLDRIDAIEVWNASYNTRYLPDPRAMRMVRRRHQSRPDLLAIAGLDQHDARNDRQVRIVLDRGCETDLFGALHAGSFSNKGLTMTFRPDLAWNPGQMIALGSGRILFDAVERVQEYSANLLRRLKEYRS